ncbi:MAG: nucleotide exchange factor GrpE [Planctomycetota bacterium]
MSAESENYVKPIVAAQDPPDLTPPELVPAYEAETIANRQPLVDPAAQMQSPEVAERKIDGQARSVVPTEGGVIAAARLAEADREELQPTLQYLLQAVEKLQTSFNDKIRYDAGREAIIDRLHAEIQEYRADLVLKLLKPMALDLINLYDDVGKMVTTNKSKVEGSVVAQKLLALLEDFQGDIESFLDRNGFTSFTSPEDEFDPKRQRTLQRVSTDDPTRDRKIAERIRKGFVYEERVIRPELVIVAVYEAKTEN